MERPDCRLDSRLEPWPNAHGYNSSDSYGQSPITLNTLLHQI